jgi:hypothetical protein
VWLVGNDNNSTFACPAGIFYTLSLELAQTIKKVPIGESDGYDSKTASDVQRALQFANSRDQKCPHSIPGLTGTKRSDAMEEELLAELRLYILVIVDDRAPPTAYVARTDGDKTYYIAGDDFISQENLLVGPILHNPIEHCSRADNNGRRDPVGSDRADSDVIALLHYSFRPATGPADGKGNTDGCYP